MKLTEEQIKVMRHALGLDRGRRSYRNRYHATVGSPAADVWTDLVALGCAALIHVERDMALFTVTDAGRLALKNQESDRG